MKRTSAGKAAADFSEIVILLLRRRDACCGPVRSAGQLESSAHQEDQVRMRCGVTREPLTGYCPRVE